MTTPISVSDLVLRDGKAEEVVYIDDRRLKYARSSATGGNGPGSTPLLSDATRIGSTHDGWRIHTGHARPESVGPDDFVEAVWNHGQRSRPESAGTLPWGDVGGERIVAYRVVPSPQVDAQPYRSAEVRMTSEYRVGERVRLVFEGRIKFVNGTRMTLYHGGRPESWSGYDTQYATIERIADPRLAVVSKQIAIAPDWMTNEERAEAIVLALDAHAKEAGR